MKYILILQPSEFFFLLFVVIMIYVIFNVGDWFEKSVEDEYNRNKRIK